MGDGNWEALPFDILIDIFSRVDSGYLVEYVQFVCKSWYQATLSPLCWQSLFIPDLYQIFDNTQSHYKLLLHRRKSLKYFVELLIRRSHGSANAIAFHPLCSYTPEVLSCIGEGFPSLKRLVLPGCSPFNLPKTLSSVICKWKNLEALEVNYHPCWCEDGYPCSLECFIGEIKAHCKFFTSLSVFGGTIGVRDANAISTLLPNIEFLSLRGSMVNRDELITILKGCKKLLYFDAGSWRSFNVDDEIRILAAHIETFKFEIDSDLDYSSG